MIVETIFMSLVVVLLLYIVYMQHKIYLLSQITLGGLIKLSDLEEEYGETQHFH
jgi:hypothetical protein